MSRQNVRMKEKVKIGILTWIDAFNYGTCLQAYALQRTIDRNIGESQIIDFRSSVRPKAKKMKKDQIIPFLESLLGKCMMSFLMWSHKREVDEKNRKYAQFRKDVVKKTEPYYSEEELSKYCADYDAYVCGSDQMWNVSARFEPNYFMAFVPCNKKIIAYAPSFGTRFINKAYEKQVSKLLMRFNSISVREKDGQKIVKELTGLEVPVVLDPTLLLTRNEWDSVSNEYTLNDEYMLVYLLSYNKEYPNPH